ncbi:putative calcium-binding protein CML36 [Cinnamomum micranthum f. kanehirae]|uniref:Putative calcium-binding protein CML36 n=1 Tax=Cinnamomum micranthum f. kanehirae TaxID=337451 RepID=A0A3S3PYV8_9MAGN|nr:putative calcium-binding protein CML36 [Cinnamomum micranthum f. kanehirae]
MKAKFSFRAFFFGSKKSRSFSRSGLSSSSSSTLSSSETPKSVLISKGSDWFHAYDGKISRQVLEVLFHRLGLEPLTEEELMLMLAEAADPNGDGCVSLEELGAPRSAEESELREAFEYFDSDGDGKISAEELLRVYSALGDERCTLEECQRMIVGVDGCEKGFVCFEDFARMMGRK